MYRILLADDEGIMLESLKKIIETNYGRECEIATAKTGRAVVELAENFRPDIAFMDIQMPGLSGVQAMREIRKFNQSTIFIVITAYDRFHYAQECISLGVLEFLTKPVNRKTILEVLQKAMQKVDGCELFICGTGPLEEELRERARDLPVHFLGRLSDEDLKSAFADCDIFVLPSVANSEGFGIVQQEAMVYGHPVINTALPTGVPYVSVNGKTGLTVPPKDVSALAQAIQTLVNSPRLREEYGRNAAVRVREEYDLETNMRRIYEILKEKV